MYTRTISSSTLSTESFVKATSAIAAGTSLEIGPPVTEAVFKRRFNFKSQNQLVA